MRNSISHRAELLFLSSPRRDCQAAQSFASLWKPRTSLGETRQISQALSCRFLSQDQICHRKRDVNRTLFIPITPTDIPTDIQTLVWLNTNNFFFTLGVRTNLCMARRTDFVDGIKSFRSKSCDVLISKAAMVRKHVALVILHFKWSIVRARANINLPNHVGESPTFLYRAFFQEPCFGHRSGPKFSPSKLGITWEGYFPRNDKSNVHYCTFPFQFCFNFFWLFCHETKPLQTSWHQDQNGTCMQSKSTCVKQLPITLIGFFDAPSDSDCGTSLEIQYFHTVSSHATDSSHRRLLEIPGAWIASQFFLPGSFQDIFTPWESPLQCIAGFQMYIMKTKAWGLRVIRELWGGYPFMHTRATNPKGPRYQETSSILPLVYTKKFNEKQLRSNREKLHMAKSKCSAQTLPSC